MKIGILITARMGSSRLPQKHLIQANGKPLIYWLFSRFENEFKSEIDKGIVKIIIATSEKEENKSFLNVVENTNVEVFFGSDDKIPLRHYQCAKQYDLDLIISVDGDDILCTVKGIRLIIDAYLQNNNYNIYSINGLPLGMNVMAYTVNYLEESLNAINSTNKLETGWGRIFINPSLKQISLGSYDINNELRFTLDYQEDATFFCTIINQLKDKLYTYTDDELIDFVEENQINKINYHLKDRYWENYNTEKEIEQKND